MSKKEKIPILGSKAVIFQNKYDVWQFRMYVKQARRYVEKSLRTKEQALAEERAEDLYIEIRNDIKNGKEFLCYQHQRWRPYVFGISKTRCWSSRCWYC